MQMFIILFCIMDVWKISYFKTLTDIQQVSTDYHVLSPVLGIGLGSRRGPKEPWPCLQELEIYSETTQQLPGKKTQGRQDVWGGKSGRHGWRSDTKSQWHRSSEGTEWLVGGAGDPHEDRGLSSALGTQEKENSQRRGVLTGSPRGNKSAVQPVQFSSVASPWTAARQASLSIPNSRSLPKVMSTEWVMPSNHLILCRPLLLLPSIFPSIRAFSNEPVLHIRWPKYWSFSFSVSPSNECPTLEMSVNLTIPYSILCSIQSTKSFLLGGVCHSVCQNDRFAQC